MHFVMCSAILGGCTESIARPPVAVSLPILMTVWLGCCCRQASWALVFSEHLPVTTVIANATGHGMLFGLQFHPRSQVRMFLGLGEIIEISSFLSLASQGKQASLQKALEPFCEGRQAQRHLLPGCCRARGHFCSAFMSTQSLEDPTVSYEKGTSE